MLSNRKTLVVLLTIAVLGAGVFAFTQFMGGGSQEGSSPESQLSAHERMKAALADVAKDAETNNHYSQSATLIKARADLAALPESALGERINLLYQMCLDEIRLGEEREAVEHVEEARELIRTHRISVAAAHRRAMVFALALGWLRVAETENCIHCRTGESCILPISENGQHTDPEASRKAISYLFELLDSDPDDLSAVWLLNIAAMTIGEYPRGVPKHMRVPESVFESKVEFPRFVDVAEASGLKTVSTGGGSIAEDFDQDGLIDVMTSEWAPDGQLRYFRNTGDGRFEELTEPAGLTGLFGGINMVQADYNNDGLVDVYIMRGAWLDVNGKYPNSLLKNLGNNRFEDVTFDVGLDSRRPTASAAWADYDNDGDLDLYVPNEDQTAHLFRNDGENGFTDVAQAAGVLNGRFGKGAVWGDYDGDRYPDIYVSNLKGENRLYHNQQDGTFKDVAPELGVTTPLLGFPTWFWDVNSDGHLDIFASSYHAETDHIPAEALDRPFYDERDSLYVNDGSGQFVESSENYGLTQTTKPMGANFGDLNNDGRPDFYLGTGFPDFTALMPNLMFVNREGSRFDNVTYPGGFGMLQKGHGISFADFDNDGDLDVFSQTGGAFPGDVFGNVLYQNPGFGNHWLRIKLVGQKSNRGGVGCRIKAVITEDGKQRAVYHWVGSGGSFGANPLVPQIGLGSATTIDQLEIFWPTTDKTQIFKDVPADGFIRINEDNDAEFETLELQTMKK